MRRLILLRHAEAEPPTPAGGDFDRPLTSRGRDQARAAGAWIAQAGTTVGLALVSPALRARQTWEGVGAALPDARCERVDALYDAPPRVILALAEAAAAENVLVVAHNPGLHVLALRLAEAGPDPAALRTALRRGLPPSAVAAFACDATGRLVGEAFHCPAETLA